MTSSKIFQGVRRPMRKKVPVAGASDRVFGHTSVPDGFEEANIEITVNLDEILRMYGQAAMGTKSGRSKLLKGAVIVRVLDRIRIPA
jgi:hypothetical protein